MITLSKRLFSFAVAIAVASSLLVAPQAAFAVPACTFSGGAGSSVSPYLVANRADLEEVALCDGAGKFFLQTADVSLAGSSWTTINDFTGTYDGGNNDITGLSITSGTYYIGLFRYVSNSTIKNIALSGTVNTPTALYVGGLMADAENSTIQDITLAVTVTGGSYVGSLAGKVSQASSVQRVSSNSTVSGTSDVGGLIGALGSSSTLVSKVAFNGSITGAANSGGIAGRMDYASITDAFSTGTMTISGTGGVGGISGVLVDGAITNTYSTMVIDTAISGRGSLLGASYRVTINPRLLTGYGVSPMALFAPAGGGGRIAPTSSSFAVAAADLQVASTFASWDLGTAVTDGKIWTICSYANNGRPFLTFQNLDCTAPVVVVTPAPIVALPRTTITGQSIKVADIRGGASLSIYGTNLADLVKVTVDGHLVLDVKATDNAITFVLPQHSADVVDVYIETVLTRIIFMDAITYVDTQPATKPASVKKPSKKPSKPVKKVTKKTK